MSKPWYVSHMNWIVAGLAVVVILVPTAAASASPTHSGRTNTVVRPDSYTQIMLPFSGLDNPGGVAADKHGDVFVSDGDNDRVLELPAGSSTQVVLLSGLDDPSYLALRKQTLFVGEGGAVIKLSIRSGKQKVLPFSGLSAVRGVAVDKHGDIFAADSDNNRVLELQVG